MLDDVEGQFRSNDACVAKTTEVHFLILQLRKFLIKPQYSPVILFLSHIVTNHVLNSIRKSCSSGSFDIEHVSSFVPVIGVLSEIRSVPDKGELSL